MAAKKKPDDSGLRVARLYQDRRRRGLKREESWIPDDPESSAKLKAFAAALREARGLTL